MLEYDRIDISEGIDINKCEETSAECDGCYDMSMKANSIQNLTIMNHNGNHCRVNFVFMSKKDAFNLIKHAVIIDKKGIL